MTNRIIKGLVILHRGNITGAWLPQVFWLELRHYFRVHAQMGQAGLTSLKCCN
jgi:hypothetical protein